MGFEIHAGVAPILRSSENKAVLAVTDGLGFSRNRSREVANAAWGRLGDADREVIVEAARLVGRDPGWALNLLYPVHVESLESDSPSDEALTWLSDLRTARAGLDTDLCNRIDSVVEATADELRYVPWAAGSRDLSELRNTNLTFPTSASGVWAGFEDLEPAVQGNSETGHQQIGNMSLAPQLPLEITQSIDSGEFFENTALNGVIERAKSRDATINFCTLLSGVGGGDGRVHSAWNHLEAFCELVFQRHGISPANVQMQAILDGRDSAADSSVVERDGSGNFLGRLQKLLASHNAENSLAWIVGRSTAMDRDYREAAAKSDFDHLTGVLGNGVADIAEVRSAITTAHASGKSDQDISPISVVRPDGSMPAISPGDAFIDLNFRSDRQRSKIASLAGARAFLDQEGRSRGREWEGSWIDHGLNLDICGMAEYHPVFESDYGVSVAFPTEPHVDNLLARWPEIAGDAEYTLIAESVKASHMGYFFRGRREGPVEKASESRKVTPSHGEEDGVKADTDFYVHPPMRAHEVTNEVRMAITAGRSKLICCNIAAPDMVGHLLPTRYEEAKIAYKAAAKALVEIARAAQEAGWHTVITSDHGNIEDDTSAHSVNDVLTTITQPGGEIAEPAIPVFQARLFDVAPTLLAQLGITGVHSESLDRNSPFAGRPLVNAG